MRVRRPPILLLSSPVQDRETTDDDRRARDFEAMPARPPRHVPGPVGVEFVGAAGDLQPAKVAMEAGVNF